MTDTTIAFVHGRRVWDSRGRPTVEAEVLLEDGGVGRAIVPAGASTGTGEALDLRDGGETFGGYDVTRAVGHVNGEIARAVTGLDAADQAALDRRLIELDGTPSKSRLGGNAVLAVSMAAAHAAAAAAGEPLYRYLGGRDAQTLPLPQIQIFGGGAHAGRRVDIQDFLVVCPAATSFAQALDWTAEVYRAAGALMQEAGTLAGVADEGGWWPAFATNEQAIETLVRAIERAGYAPGSQVAIALDVAASEFGRGGKYKLALEDKELDSEGMIKLLTGWIRRYPIVSIEDPLAEDDDVGFAAFTREVGGRVQVIGDDFLVSQASRVREAAVRGAANAVLLKPNQRGTLTETFEAWQAAQEAGFAGIVSARSGETEDTTIVHLAVGWGVGQLKVGSFARGERMAKWNEALRIEEALGGRARFAGGAVLGRSTEMNVLFHYTAGPDLAARLAAIPDLRITICPEHDDALLARLLPDTDVIWHVLKRCTAEMIAAAPKLRLIQKIGVGVNTIDLDAAKQRGIAVCNLPGTNARAVAELTLALMLAVLRRLPRFDAAMRRGEWLDPDLQDGIGELGGRTIGLVGYGAIPRLLAPVLIALGCRVIYTSRAPHADALGEWRSLDALLAEADVVSLHLPLTDDTADLIDAAAFARMKPGAVLINTARGGLVDQLGADRGAGKRQAGRRRPRRVRPRTTRRVRGPVPPAQRRADPAHRLAHHRHVRSEFRTGRGELPPPRGRRVAAASGGVNDPSREQPPRHG